MRRIVAYTLMSLDGGVDDPAQYFEPSDDPADPFRFDDECEAFEAETIATQDCVLLGRNMYDEWCRFWPGVSGQPFAEFINAVRKYVVTSSPLGVEWANTVPVHGPVETVVADLKAEPGEDIGVHGSIELLRSLLEADLVDELRIIAGPVVGTSGRRLFDGLSRPRRLRLAQASPTPGGNLMLRYDARA